MSKKRSCVVHGCGGDFQCLRFPHPGKHPSRFKEWMSLLQREDLLITQDPITIYHNKRICKNHFSEKCYYQNYLPGRCRLRDDAVPDLNLPSSTSLALSPSPSSSEAVIHSTGRDFTYSAEDKENHAVVNSSKDDNRSESRSKDNKKAEPNPTRQSLGNKENQAIANSSKDHNILPESTKTTVTKTVLLNQTPTSHDQVLDMDYHYAQSVCQPLLQKEISVPKKKLEKKYIVKVLGEQKLEQPEAITSLLNKIKLSRKKGSVYIIPLKKKGNFTKLTQNRLTKIIENSTSVKNSLKHQLIKILKSKNLSFKQHIQDKSALKKKHLRARKARRCTCPVHCITRGYKKQKVYNVSPGLHIKIGGSCLRDSQRDNIFEEAENVFTVSSIITNVNDKDQLERLCQLVLESIFKLKNVNVNGTMSKIELFLCQNSEAISDVEMLSNETVNVPPFTSELVSTASNNFDMSSGGVDHSCGSISRGIDNDIQFLLPQNTHGEEGITVPDVISNMSVPEEYLEFPSTVSNRNCCQKEKVKNYLKVDLNFYHDHSYLSLDSQVLFQKPPYLVNLINIDKYKSSKKKTRVIRRMPSEPSKKGQKELSKLRKQIARLRELMKSKNKNIEKISEKLKYLRNKLCKEQGLKRIRYPKNTCNADSINLLNSEEENLDVSKSNSEINNKIEKKKKCKRKKKIILTPDFEVPPAECHSPQTSIVEYEDKCEFFYDTFLEEYIEKG